MCMLVCRCATQLLCLTRHQPRHVQAKVAAGRMAPEAHAKLTTLASVCSAYDFRAAQKIITDLLSIDWAETKEWHGGLRYMVNIAILKMNASR